MTEPAAPSTPSSQPPSKTATAARFATAAVALVGILFLVGAWAKLAAPGLFEITMVKQGLFADRGAAAWPARLVIAFELAVGIGLLQPWRRRAFSAVAAGLLVIFSVWLGYLILAGPTVEDCGCFGKLIKISPGVALARNLVMLAMIAAAWRHLRTRQAWTTPIAIVIVATVATFAIAPVKPTTPPPREGPNNGQADAPRSPVARFTDFSDGTIDLTTGDHVIAFFSLDCEHCMEVARQLAAHAPELPPVHVVFFGSEDQLPNFQGMSGSAFPWLIADPGTFFDLIGEAPPRIYLLRDGVEISHWDDPQLDPGTILDAISQ